MKRHPVAAFVALTLALSWGVWIPWVLAARGLIKLPAVLSRAHWWGAFAPGVAALILTGAFHGREGLRRLFERFLLWRVGAGWFAAALLLPAVASLGTTALHMMFGGDPPDYARLPIENTPLWALFKGFSVGTMILPLFLHQLAVGSGLSEELGWRGFALPRLQQRFDALTSSFILAAVWAVWVVPLAFAEPQPQPLWWALTFGLLGALPGAILTTWLFNNARGSLLVTVGFNNAVKVTGLLLALPADARPVIGLAPWWILAIAVVAWAGARTLCWKPLHPNCTEGASEPTPPPAPVELTA